jgi:predicted alpha/beta hydrolase family esterase
LANIFIFHGVNGYPDENWFPWLKRKLELLNHKIIIPQFPTPENQTLENWFKVFSLFEKYLLPGSILIGHSLGGTFLLRVLEKYKVKIARAFIVAAPIGILPIDDWENEMSFYGSRFEWDTIINNCKSFYIFHSNNDHYVSVQNSKTLAGNLNGKLLIVPYAGHFNNASGFDKFDLLYNIMISKYFVYEKARSK